MRATLALNGLTTRATLKSILKKCSRFCHSFSNVSGFLSLSFLHNHIAATLPFFLFFFCSSEWLFFWEIVQSVSLFLKFLGQNFHVTPSELSIIPIYQNQCDFIEAKASGKNISQQPFVFFYK